MYTTVLGDDKVIRRDEDGAFIPFDERNRDYQEYLAWINKGNKPKLAEQPLPPPSPEPTLKDVMHELRSLSARVDKIEKRK